MKKLLLAIFVLSFYCVKAQNGIPISGLSTYYGNPSGGWVPVVINGVTRKMDGGWFGYKSFDSVAISYGATVDTFRYYNRTTGINFTSLYTHSSGGGLIFPNAANLYLNGYGGFVNLNTDTITEGTVNKFFTNARSRTAISLTTTGTSGAATYNSSTGVLNIPQYSSGSGIVYPNTTNKYLNGYGNFVLLSTDTLTEGNTNLFYTNSRSRNAVSLTTIGVSGVATYTPSSGTFNIPQYQGALSFPNTINKYLNGYNVFATLNSDSVAEGITNQFFTNARARSSISLTTTGSSGAATYNNSTGILNIPQYSGGSFDSATAQGSAPSGGFHTLLYNDTRYLKTANNLAELTTTAATVRSNLGITSSASVYFAPAASFNPEFVVCAMAIVFPQNTYVFHDSIQWAIENYTTGHNSSFYDSVYGRQSTGALRVTFPNVKGVLNTTITTDESFQKQGIHVGPSTAFTNFEAQISQDKQNSVVLTGAGTTTWTKSGTLSTNFTVSTYNTSNGVTFLDVPSSSGVFTYDPATIQIQYVGPNAYRIQRLYSGLGSYTVGFQLLDAMGNPVTASPSTSDQIVITNGGLFGSAVNAWQYDGSNTFMGSFTNFWVVGFYECWMIANPVDSNHIQVKWQTNYPSATTYKIYRDVTPAFSSPVLIHTGTEGVYTDGGLTNNTLYYYKEVAVVGGVDIFVTTFKTNTVQNL